MNEPEIPPPEPLDPAARRREQMLAFHLGALEDPDEIALIRGRLESAPEWRQAGLEAQAMLQGLTADGADAVTIPEDLGARTARKVQAEGAATEPRIQNSKFKIQNFPFPPRLAAAIFFLCALPALWLAARYASARPASESLYWRAESQVAAGAPFAPDIIVRDTWTKKPLAGVRLVATLVQAREVESKGTPIGEGMTGPAGMLSGAAWRIPEVPPGEYRLILEARSASGRVLDRAEREVGVTNAARLALAPDRTQARPGEKIRARALLVSSAGERPLADRPVTLDLFDPAGNRIARKEAYASRFGLAWAEFPLDSEAPEGEYKLAAESGGLKSERSVAVKQYRLPPFRVRVEPGKPWFGERDRVQGRLVAQTFDGHAVAQAKGELQALDLQGKVLQRADLLLDQEGRATFELPMPPNLLDKEVVQSLRLEARLTDPAGRSASGQCVVNVSRHALLVSAVPEAGELVQGVENRVYFVVRRPDGTPVRTTLQVSRQGGQDDAQAVPTPVETDARGVGVFTLSAPQAPAEVLRIFVKSEKIPLPAVSLAVRPVEPKAGSSAPYGRLLVRPEKAVLRAGEKLSVNVLAGDLRQESSSVTLALKQDGRTLAIGSAGVSPASSQLASGSAGVPPANGEVQLTVPEGVAGLLALEATLAFPDGRVWTDRRALLVSGASNLKLVASADRENATYQPGERARVAFRVTNSGGQGVPAAVSVVAVDRALLALTGENPGLAQALAAAGVPIPSLPGFPLVPASFSPEEGAQDAAHAALAAVRPREGGGEKDKGTVVDTSAAKLAAFHQTHTAARNLLRQCALGLAGIGLVLLVLIWAGAANSLTAGMAVPLVTLLVGVAGVLGAAILRMPNPALFIGILTATLVAVHGYLLVQLSNGNGAQNNTRLHIVTLVTDLILELLSLPILVEGNHGNAGGFAVLLGVGVFVAALFQYSGYLETYGKAELLTLRKLTIFGGASALILLIIATTLPMLAKTRNSARRLKSDSFGAVANSGAAFSSDLAGDPMHLQAAAAQPPEVISTNDSPSSPPRLRWDFPETLVFAPQLVTDEDGRATLEVPLADSLTEWRVQADSIAAAGGTAWAECGLTVTQPFSVDLTLPTDVTAGDILTVPAVVSNHTNAARKVALALEVTGATAQDGSTREIFVEAKGVAAAEFSLRFDKSGIATLRLEAKATKQGREIPEESDAVERVLTVLPEGRPVGFAASALIHQEGELQLAVPEIALPGTVRARLTLHRGPLTQMLEGLEAMLREPHGCFEQTSSTNYPNVMVLRYLKAHGIQHPAVEQRARDFLARGYQRLLGFECGGRSGSFSLYGQAPASLWLTAYGLKQFSDMAAVYPVEPALLERIRAWLRARMSADGSFPMDEYRVHEAAPKGLAATAYVVWALGEHAPAQSITYLRERVSTIERDAYVCALAAHALGPHDRATAAHLAGKLRALAQFGGDTHGGAKADGERATASLPATSTLAWGHGNTAAVEANALGVLALLESGQDMDLARLLLASLQRNLSPGGGWGSTHATVLALHALERGASTGRAAGPARIVVELDGRPLAPITLPAEESAAPFAVPLELKAGAARLRVRVEGGPVAVRVTGECHVPWMQEAPNATAPLQARVNYADSSVARGQAVLGTLELSSKGRKAEVPMVEWGLPAGFEPEAAGLDDLKAKGTVSRWERSGRTLRLYLPDLAAEQAVRLAVRFFATAKGELQGQAGRAYEYYRRHEAAAIQPASFVVR